MTYNDVDDKSLDEHHLELGHDDHDYNCVQGLDEILDEHHLELGPGRGGKVLAVLIN